MKGENAILTVELTLQDEENTHKNEECDVNVRMNVRMHFCSIAWHCFSSDI